MFAEESSDAVQLVPPRRTSWLTWLAAILVMLFAFGYFVVKPLVETAVQGATAVLNELVEDAVKGLATFMTNLYNGACQRVEQSDAVKTLVGEPIQCAPIEECEWLQAGDRNELEFKFEFTGPEGTLEAHVVAVATKTGFELKSIDITGPAGEVTLLLEP